MKMTPEQAAAAWRRAEVLYDATAVAAAYDRLAVQIGERLRERDPLLLCVLSGGIVVAGQLLPRLDFPLRLDYIHATRYNRGTQGGELEWVAHPRTPLAGETVLLVDDIHDEGHTLAALVEACRAEGADAVYSAVLIDKQHGRKHPYRADFVGLECGDHYLAGCGMDYHEYLRNAPEILAIREE